MDPKTLNLLICVLFIAFNFYYIHRFNDRYSEDYRFLFRAYILWFASWCAWAITWTLIIVDPDWLKCTPISSGLMKRRAGDLNAVALITMYFVLTRGRDYSNVRIRIAVFYIFSAMLVVYLFLYLVTGNTDLELRLQDNFSLFLAITAPILAGWGFKMRYGTVSALVVGAIYGFSRTALFEADVFESQKAAVNHGAFNDGVQIAVAFLKIFWAAAVTRQFEFAPPSSESLIKRTTLDRTKVRSWIKSISVPWSLQILSMTALAMWTVLGYTGSDKTGLFLSFSVLVAATSLIGNIDNIIRKVKEWLEK